MEPNTQRQLEEACAHFRSWRMAEAYAILRRFFDRLPFRPEKAHAENIGTYVRILGELGKVHELKFYVPELEKHYEQLRDPAIGYTLAVVYLNLYEPQPEAAREILEEIIRHPAADGLRDKAKVVLANYYDRFKGDTAACRSLIDSIGPLQDEFLARLVVVWKGKLLGDEKHYVRAETMLKDFLARVDRATDWYAHVSAQIVLAIQFLRQKRFDEASAVIGEVRHAYEGRLFKTVQIQVAALEEQLRAGVRLGVVRFESDDDGSTLFYRDQSLRLKRQSSAEKLMSLFLSRTAIGKKEIIEFLYGRAYQEQQDDRLVYYHIHSLRKRLSGIGLPTDVISVEGEGYRWLAALETAA